MKKNSIKKVLEILATTYPNARTELKFNNPFQLLIATILSAQSTDKQVNKITENLFKKYKTPEDIAKLDLEEFAEEIKGVGLYRNKAKNIIETGKILKEKYNSKVPENFEELLKLPGVGRKTANVILSNAFQKDAIAVDTHVFRVANRIGLAKAKDVLSTEKNLMKNIPRHQWSKAHHWLIWHGRNICRARKPKCMECPLKYYCRYFRDN